MLLVFSGLATMTPFLLDVESFDHSVKTQKYLVCESGYEIKLMNSYDEEKREVVSKYVCVNDRDAVIDAVTVDVR